MTQDHHELRECPELLPCRWCGSHEVGESHYSSADIIMFYVYCQLCGVRMVASDRNTARERWNARTDTPSPPDGNNRPTPSPRDAPLIIRMAKAIHAVSGCEFAWGEIPDVDDGFLRYAQAAWNEAANEMLDARAALASLPPVSELADEIAEELGNLAPPACYPSEITTDDRRTARAVRLFQTDAAKAAHIIAAYRTAIEAALRSTARTEQEIVAALTGALETILAGEFNCSPHQRFMAAQGVAKRTLAKVGAYKTTPPAVQGGET